MIVGGFGGEIGEGADFRKAVTFCGGEFTAERVAGDVGESVSKSGDVVGLTGCHERDDAGLVLLR